MTDAERYRKLRRWMTSNVSEGWTQVERLAAIGCYLSWDDFDGYLDDLPECNFGLVANCPPDNRIVRTMANGLTEAETSATASVQGLTVKPWTKWDGWEKEYPPVKEWETVQYKLRGEGDEEFINSAGGLYWHHDGGRDDIVAYRVL